MNASFAALKELENDPVGFDIAKAYEKGELDGHAENSNPGLAKESFNLLSSTPNSGFVNFGIQNKSRIVTGKKFFIHELVRKVLGQDTPNYPQQIGDCVAFGAKNATEYLTCSQIIMAAIRQTAMNPLDYIQAARIKFRPVFPSYYYGTGRVYIGKGRLGNGDGSLGSWMAKAVMEFGTLFADEADVPKYAGKVSKSWGSPGGAQYLDKWKPTADEYDVKSAALIKSWDEFVEAICNGYPITTASNYGYSMEPGRDGFHTQTAKWGHQMCFTGVDDNDKDPYALMLNSWGNVHGVLKDFDGDETLPAGTLRIRRKDVEKHIRAGELFAFSSYNGFPEQLLDKALFLLV